MANYISQVTLPSGTSYNVRELFPHVGNCTDAAATAAKTVTIGNFKLYTGAWVVVKFSNTNSAAVASLTLNVDGTGAKPIKYRNANLSSPGLLIANRYTYFIYDGTNYQIVGDFDTGYTHPTHTAYPSGLYKVTVDGLGHVSAATAATKADIPALDYLPNTTKYALSDSVGGSAKTADKLTNARTIAIDTGVTSTATSFDGSANITIPVTGIKEAYLTWGGKDFSSSFSPLDAALEPRLGANRLEMCPGSGIKIERTTDGGTTWTEVSTSSISNAQRSALFSSAGYGVPVSATSTAGMGSNAAKYMMRITLDTSVANVYTNLLKFILNISTNGCANCYVKLRIRTAANVSAGNDTWLTWDKTNKTWSSSPTEANTKCPIGGWSGYNVINFTTFTTYGNQTSHYRNVQFIFGCSQNDSTYPGLSIINIQGYGGVAWSAPSNMARTGHLYSWNGTGEASFPSSVTATNFNGKLNTMTISGTNNGSYNLNNFLVTNDITAGDTNGKIKVKSTNLTIYTHPSYTAKTSGLYKITVDSTGHVSGTAAVTGSDLPAHTHSDYVLKTGDTMSGNLTFTVADGSDTPGIVFKRGNFTDSTLDWKIYNSAGALMMDRTVAGDTETWQNKFKVDGTGIWYGGTQVSLVGHTHNYAGSTTAGGAATNIATTVTNGVSVGSTYYGVIFAADPNTSGGYPARKNDDFKYGHVDGTVSSTGYAEIILGNNKDSTTAGNKRGVLTLYSKGTSYHSIETTETSTSVKHTLPATTGTILNSGTTSFTQVLSSGTKIGTIKINGTSTDLYCETNTNTDTKVTQSSSTTSDFRPLLLGKNNQTNPENLETTVTDQTYVTKHVFVQPSTGNLTLYNASGDSPSLIFRRGTLVDNLNDWKIYVSGGGLYFAQSTANASSETWTNRMYFHPSDGNLYVGSTKVSLSNHTHGNITSGGALQTTDITIASGDKLVVTDSSDSNKVARASISFDGSTTSKCLTQKGTWETPPDTKNTAGSTDTSSKIFLIGATSQAANPQTYSDNEVYTTSGVLTTKKVQVGGGSCTMEYNSTTQTLDFVFV